MHLAFADANEPQLAFRQQRCAVRASHVIPLVERHRIALWVNRRSAPTCGCKFATVLAELATPFDDQLSLETLVRLVYRHPKEWHFPDVFDTGVSGLFFMSTTYIAVRRLVIILEMRRYSGGHEREFGHHE